MWINNVKELTIRTAIVGNYIECEPEFKVDQRSLGIVLKNCNRSICNEHGPNLRWINNL